MTVSLLTILLVFAAVARATRLFTTDQIIEPIRLKIIERFGVDSQITYLAHCQWCLSVWLGLVGAIIVALVAPLPDVNLAVQIVGLTAAYSYLTGVLGERFGAQIDQGGEA